jgi:16S rRNA (uracil1498-N3)-methyltransferase
MECLYISDLVENSDIIILNEAESKHTKSLRLSIGDEVLVTNGDGLSAVCILEEYSKKGNTLKCRNFFRNLNELRYEITLAVGVLDNPDRFEFVIEKAVELGASEIVPIISKFSGNKHVRYERAIAKSVAALKQSKRSILPIYSEPVYLSQLYDKFDNWDVVILADENGEKKLNLEGMKKILILCGPEGGFSEEEIAIINKSKNIQNVKLGSSRLRSETAAISALSVVVFNLM